jgi:hypothetical protein
MPFKMDARNLIIILGMAVVGFLLTTEMLKKLGD